MKEVYLKIEGRVQRVGFRRWAIMKAAEIDGISGWVRNESDGSVEIFMNGEDGAVNAMVQLCYQGPLFARVDKVSFLEKSCYVLPPVQEGKFVKI